jgi:hypothetical protein
VGVTEVSALSLDLRYGVFLDVNYHYENSSFATDADRMLEPMTEFFE